jgi:hypothetical protein
MKAQNEAVGEEVKSGRKAAKYGFFIDFGPMDNPNLSICFLGVSLNFLGCMS